MEEYNDEDLLMLSGIQHIAFCERQYALSYIEMQWLENVFTVEGHHLHEKVDDPFEKENRGDTSILRALPLVSRKLGLNGIADVVELIKADVSNASGAEISGKTGKWLLLPVEYKRGKPKPDERDEVQLCAQAMCLEEMYKTKIEKGYLYYGETRHRHEVLFTEPLRQLVANYANRMHELFSKGITPAPVFKSHCKSCSLKDICLPSSLANQPPVSEYLKNVLSD
jgi:CRISPR-associated exonuclease Cas4